jgi:hypothetical protein
MAELSFDEAVHLFNEWGFQVELGPREGEVTLTLDGEDGRTWIVWRVEMLPQVAEVILRTRWQNGTVMAQPACFLHDLT